MENLKLKKIAKKFEPVNYNTDNYFVGGGLDGSKFASNRHEDANNDAGKLTLGEATAKFAKATNNTTAFVKELIWNVFPSMEWHHAGLLPKAYGGGMKKTFFLNSKQIIDLASNWYVHVEKFETKEARQQVENVNYKNLLVRKNEFLNLHAKKITRVCNAPENFYETDREMDGKFGWFSSYGKNYKMTEYLSGWAFESAEKMTEYFAIK